MEIKLWSEVREDEKKQKNWKRWKSRQANGDLNGVKYAYIGVFQRS